MEHSMLHWGPVICAALYNIVYLKSLVLVVFSFDIARIFWAALHPEWAYETHIYLYITIFKYSTPQITRNQKFVSIQLF